MRTVCESGADKAALTPTVLFLCTGNSARSQMAEALLTVRSAGRYRVGSAGAHPVTRVNPYAVEALQALGIAWHDKRPKSIDEVLGESWDLVITVCERAKESCPTLPGRPVYAHWGLDDPAAIEGDEATVRAAFRRTALDLSRRIELFLSVPAERVVNADWRTTSARGKS